MYRKTRCIARALFVLRLIRHGEVRRGARTYAGAYYGKSREVPIMGAKKKYSAAGLGKAVDKYFRSISREKIYTEAVATGRKDSMGHEIYEQKPVLNGLGEELTVVEYLVPPTVGGLSAFLGVHRSTWNAWCDSARYPEYQEVTQDAMSRIHAYLELESLTRPGKDLKGVLFNLENNYGYKERTKVEVTGSGGIEDYLSGLTGQGDGTGGCEF